MNNAIERVRQARKDESGMALLSTIGLMMFVFVVVVSLMMSTMISTQISTDTRTYENSVSSSDSAIDSAVQAATVGKCVANSTSSEYGYTYKVYRTASATAPIKTADAGVSAGCPVNGDKYMLVEATGKNSRGKDTKVVAVYKWVKAANNGVDGAITAGSTGGLSNYTVLSGEGADLVILKGAFNCANNVRVDGDLIVLEGGASLSNSCNIKGDVYANGDVSTPNGVNLAGSVYSSGNINLTNSAKIGGNVIAAKNVEMTAGASITGDLYAGGDMFTSNTTSVYGNAYVKGALRFNNSTHIYGNLVSLSTGTSSVTGLIDGDLYTAGSLNLGGGTVIGKSVYSSGTAAVQYFNVKVNGNVTINGSFSQLQATTIGGDVRAVAKGAVNGIAPDVTAKSIAVGGTISTWSSGPKANPIVTNATVATAPVKTFVIPSTEKPVRPWRDYAYVASDWSEAGYSTITPSVCNYQNSTSAIAQINNLTTPTVVDLRSCSSINMYGVAFKLKTNVAFIGNRFSSMGAVTLAASDSKVHNLYVITSDNSTNQQPTCGTNQGAIDMYGLKSDSYIRSFFYTPCNISFGGNGTINGQLYGGGFTDGATSTIYYNRLVVPGFPSDVTPADTFYDTSSKTRPAPKLVGRTES
jgi:cytoskeletal protein CcmA (bactofilin family)